MDKIEQLFHFIESENEYIRKNIQNYSKLSDSDKEIIFLKLNGYLCKEIATKMNLREEIIHVTYLEIIKMLKIKNEDGLNKFASVFGII